MCCSLGQRTAKAAATEAGTVNIRESVAPPPPSAAEIPQLLTRPRRGKRPRHPRPENEAGPDCHKAQTCNSHDLCVFHFAEEPMIPSPLPFLGQRGPGARYPVRVLTHHPSPPGGAVLTLPSGVQVAVPPRRRVPVSPGVGVHSLSAFIPCVLTLSSTLPPAQPCTHPRVGGHVLVLQPIYRGHAGQHTLRWAGRAEAPASGHNKARRRCPRSSNPKGIAPQEASLSPTSTLSLRQDALARTKRLSESQSTLPLEDMVVCSHDNS